MHREGRRAERKELMTIAELYRELQREVEAGNGDIEVLAEIGDTCRSIDSVQQAPNESDEGQDFLILVLGV
jgi:hypothetical protein